MKNWYSGSLYLVPRDWNPASPDADQDIVHTYEHGEGHFQVAIELWALSNPSRAARIEQLLARAYERDPHILEESEIAELLELLDGLEASLVGSFVDEHWHVPADRLPELKRRTTMLEIDEVEGAVAGEAVAAGFSRVSIAREILRTALDEHLNILTE